MRRILPLIVMLLASCGGGGSGVAEFKVSGKLEASEIKGLKVCVAETDNCTLTKDDGSFTLSSPTPTPELEFFIKGENGDIKLGDYKVRENGEVITPFKIAGDPEAGDALARIIHALNNDTDGTSNLIDLTEVTVENSLTDSIEEAIKKGEDVSLNFSFNGENYSLEFNATTNKVKVCQDTCQEVKYRKWLVLLYIDADNNLGSQGFAGEDVEELSQVHYSPEVKVVALIDSPYLKDGTVYASNDTTGNFERVEELKNELNMGDPQTLIDFVETYSSKYPANRTALIIWDHGDGWRSLRTLSFRIASIDENADSTDYLFMYELRDALKKISQDGYRIDLLGFDECLMGNLEVLFDVKDYASVIVASETSEPGSGWNYEKVMTKLLNNPDADAYTFGKYIVDAYEEEYQGESNLTLAAFKKEEIESLVNELNSLAQSLNDSNALEFQEARSNLESAGADISGKDVYVDLATFASKLYELDPSIEAAKRIETIIKGVYKTLINTDLQGLSIYFPASSGDYSPCYGITTPSECSELNDSQYYNPFAVNDWDEMLQNYYSLTGN
ncbi:MAG: hypothetical protein DSY35_00725 [Desulfurobacterium sp.]|nr:MAG: hypothetical protein DSY35_00725 [Desulfurobacterium sp.]